LSGSSTWTRTRDLRI